MTKEELKKIACEIIDSRRGDITALGDSIFAEPETGWKEFKTAEKIKKVFESLGFPTKDKQCITGVIADVKGKEKKLKVSVMGELDALGVPDSPNADPVTGAAHMCGHHCMIAALSGVAYALADRRIMDELSGDVALMAVPAEEFVEMAYRGQLRREGKIKMFGGKQEFIYRGLMDDIDMMVMQHNTATEGTQETPIKANVGGTSNGFVSKEVFYKGKAAHAGGAPFNGINALNAKSRAAEIQAFLEQYIPNVERMQTQLKKYKGAFTDTMTENKRLKAAFEHLTAEKEDLEKQLKAATTESIQKKLRTGKLQEDYEKARSILSRIPPEVLRYYTASTRPEPGKSTPNRTRKGEALE